jgi:DNA primase
MTVDFSAAKATRLSAVVGQSVQLKRSGGEWLGCCPFHNDHTPSFTVNDGKAFAHCFGCGWHGDAVDFVAAMTGCTVADAARLLGAGDLPTLPTSSRAKDLPQADTADAARRIWREAEPIAGTPAELYLRSRGIHIQLPPTLRFTRLRHLQGGVHPCLVGIATEAEGRFGGIQRTYLTEGGRKSAVAPVKMSLGRISTCAIRLTPMSGELVVCEGIEDGLSLLQELGRAVWVAAGASMLSAMQFPMVVRSVVIAADNDAAGEREADKAAEAFTARGFTVRIMRPAPEFKDFNEQLISGGRLAA